MKKRRLFSVVSCILLFSCRGVQNTLYSKNYAADEKLQVLTTYIAVKSPIEWTEFSLFDVNMKNNSVPGASSKRYKIVMKVRPGDAHYWIDGKEYWITSFPHKMDWIESILDGERAKYIRSLGYMTYHYEEPGIRYTLWVNADNGVIILEYNED